MRAKFSSSCAAPANRRCDIRVDASPAWPHSRTPHPAFLPSRPRPSSRRIFLRRLATRHGGLGFRAHPLSSSSGDPARHVDRHGQDRIGRLAPKRFLFNGASLLVAFPHLLQRRLRGQHGAALHRNHDLPPRDALARRHDTDLFSFRVGCVPVHLGKVSRSPSDICKARQRMLKTV